MPKRRKKMQLGGELNRPQGLIKRGSGQTDPTSPHGLPKDDVPAILGKGEFVLNANTVKQVGIPFLEQLNNIGLGSSQLPKNTGKYGTYQEGGMIQTPRVSNDYSTGRGKKRTQLSQKYGLGVNLSLTEKTNNEIRRTNGGMRSSLKDIMTTKNGLQGSVPLQGTTTNQEGHIHEYRIDNLGNGVAYEVVHPEARQIRHFHKVRNYQILPAKSNCYPNCKDVYGVEGAANHVHHLPIIPSDTRERNAVIRELSNTATKGNSIITVPSQQMSAKVSNSYQVGGSVTKQGKVNVGRSRPVKQSTVAYQKSPSRGKKSRGRVMRHRRLR